MDIKEILKQSEELTVQTYNLAKSLEAFMYRVLPPDTDVENDYSLTLAGVLSNQGKLVESMAEDLHDTIENLSKHINAIEDDSI